MSLCRHLPLAPRRPTGRRADSQVLRRAGVASFMGTFRLVRLCLYGFLATVIAAVFFPEADARSALIATYAVFALSFIVRPIGGMVRATSGVPDRAAQAPLAPIFIMSAPPSSSPSCRPIRASALGRRRCCSPPASCRASPPPASTPAPPPPLRIRARQPPRLPDLPGPRRRGRWPARRLAVRRGAARGALGRAAALLGLAPAVPLRAAARHRRPLHPPPARGTRTSRRWKLRTTSRRPRWSSC